MAERDGRRRALLVFATVTVVLTWLVRTLIDYRRWLRLSKVQTEAHSKLLDRFTSGEDLAAYLQSSPGRKFLESAPIPLDAGPRSISAPLGRILWSIQAGLVAGPGRRRPAVRERRHHRRGRSSQSARSACSALMFGIGFILSAVVSYVLSQRLGLLEGKPLVGAPTGVTPEDRQA